MTTKDRIAAIARIKARLGVMPDWIIVAVDRMCSVGFTRIAKVRAAREVGVNSKDFE